MRQSSFSLSESTIRKDSSRRFVLWKTSERSVEPPQSTPSNGRQQSSFLSREVSRELKTFKSARSWRLESSTSTLVVGTG